jgi:hypothetical protein
VSLQRLHGAAQGRHLLPHPRGLDTHAAHIRLVGKQSDLSLHTGRRAAYTDQFGVKKAQISFRRNVVADPIEDGGRQLRAFDVSILDGVGQGNAVTVEIGEVVAIAHASGSCASRWMVRLACRAISASTGPMLWKRKSSRSSCFTNSARNALSSAACQLSRWGIRRPWLS